MRWIRFFPCAAVAGLVLLSACSEEPPGAVPEAPGLYTLRGHVQLTGYWVNAQGTFAGTQVVRDADGVPVELLDGASVAARTSTTNGTYEFSGLPPGAYQTRTRLLGSISDVSAVFTIIGSDLNAGDTLRIGSHGDLLPVPNPVEDETFIYFNLPVPDSQFFDLRVSTLALDTVRTLLKAWRPHGLNQARWDGTDRLGNPVPAGLYWVTFTSGSDERAQLLFKVDPSLQASRSLITTRHLRPHSFLTGRGLRRDSPTPRERNASGAQLVGERRSQ